MYVLGYDTNNNLGTPSNALLQNLKTYLSDYRMLTDAVNIKPAYIINIGCNFDILMRPNYNGQDVITRCLVELKSFFNIDNWQINEPIILSDIYTLLDVVEGVQTVRNVQITNKFNGDYSKYSYDIPGATADGVVYPSLDPSIFEVKFLDSDIQGRIIAN
jgi:phage-related baseplate assembly protein